MLLTWMVAKQFGRAVNLIMLSYLVSYKQLDKMIIKNSSVTAEYLTTVDSLRPFFRLFLHFLHLQFAG